MQGRDSLFNSKACSEVGCSIRELTCLHPSTVAIVGSSVCADCLDFHRGAIIGVEPLLWIRPEHSVFTLSPARSEDVTAPCKNGLMHVKRAFGHRLGQSSNCAASFDLCVVPWGISISPEGGRPWI